MKRPIIFFLMAVCWTAAFAQPADRDWAMYNRYSAENAALEQAPPVVFMGNSITENWYRFHPGFFEGHHFAARGISGQTTCHMLARFQRDVVDLHPDLVVILAGINDIARNNGLISLENIAGNIKSMCEIARYNGIEPILCSVLPCDRFSWRKDLSPAAQVKALNALLRTYAREAGIRYVDFYSALADRNGALPDSLSKDGCHPYPDVYLGMEETILGEISRWTRKNGREKASRGNASLKNRRRR